MFVRIITKAQLKQTLAMMKKEFQSVPKPGDTLHQLYAPDGDLVFSALEHSKDRYIARFHPEVFDEGTLPLDQSKGEA